MLRRGRLGQHTDHLPVVVGDGLRNDPSTFAVGGREAGDEEGVAEGSEIIFGHQGRVRNVDIGTWLHPMVCQELGDLRQQGYPLKAGQLGVGQVR